ncbi:MAG: hypothetical protein AB7F86_14100, partial [Bdellovibrionales bacterium]
MITSVFLAFIVSSSPSIAASPPWVPSKARTLCEKVLIGTGLWHSRTRALIRPTSLEANVWELAAYHPSSYDLFFLNELSYYLRSFLSPAYLAGKRVLDLNAGNGELTEDLRRKGIDAVGLSVR